MARRKIVVATMMHETNTFSPVPTPLASFRPLTGDAAIQEFKEIRAWATRGLNHRRPHFQFVPLIPTVARILNNISVHR